MCIDPLPSYVWFQDMADFAKLVTDERAERRLTRAIQGRGAFRRFKDELHQNFPDLLPVWSGGEQGPERTLFWEWRAEGYQQLAAMRGDMKLVVTGQNPPELFDVPIGIRERTQERVLEPGMELDPPVARRGTRIDRLREHGLGLRELTCDDQRAAERRQEL